ncbi:uncharacterized protein LOC134862580 [Eleginops maclovinus]|uniref:uncharacterized protein LOC134862580 n=1 Tax=Eleginops maclovinus TaxID=56733 RepID=UPI0030809141
MDAVLLLIMAAAGLSAVSSHAERQYHFVYEAKNMSEAQRYCREKHTDLATVDSMEVVELLNNMAGHNKQSAWIGLYHATGSWRWSLSDTSFYKPGETEFRRWWVGGPNNFSWEKCSIISSNNGNWDDLVCDILLSAVCCDVTGTNATFVSTEGLMTWPEAQSYCREHHTDLASVRNQTENQQIVELLHERGNYWIGLSRPNWTWSDGSPSSFRYWREKEPNCRDPNVCVAADFYNSGKWDDLDCGVMKPFICYKNVPVSMQVIKVRVPKPNSGVDLNDPAFLEEMLVQAKKNLRAQGLDDNIKLTWRKQPDGKVFQKEQKCLFNLGVRPWRPTSETLSSSALDLEGTHSALLRFAERNQHISNSNRCITDFLSDRKQQVRLAKHVSDPRSYHHQPGNSSKSRTSAPSSKKPSRGSVFLRELKNFNLLKPMLMNFYSASNKSILISSITIWNAAATGQGRMQTVAIREQTKMDLVLLLIMAAAGLSAVSSHAERKYHFVYETKSMPEAQRYCREKHTDLATVDSMEVVELLNNMFDPNLLAQYRNYSVWIGLYDDRDTWRWSLSDTSFYKPGETEFRRWGSGQPINTEKEQCGVIYHGDGTMQNRNCKAIYKVVCCDATGPDATFVLINSTMNWTEAQSHCREHHTDLASVRNQTENQQVQEMVAAGGSDAWIGLYRDSWKWSDGSTFSFRYWREKRNLTT